MLGILTVALTLATACDGDGDPEPLALKDYFVELERINDELDAETDKVEEPEFSENPSHQEASEKFIAFLREATILADEAIDELNDLDAPSEVSDEHDAFVLALQDGRDEIQDSIGAIENTESLEEFTGVLGGIEESFRGSIEARFEEACNDLQAIADENEIDVDLEC